MGGSKYQSLENSELELRRLVFTWPHMPPHKKKLQDIYRLENSLSSTTTKGAENNLPQWHQD